jgi:hypothetical protein
MQAFYNPEGGGITYLRNVSNYTNLHVFTSQKALNIHQHRREDVNIE